MSKKDETYAEMSKRIDGIENDIYILRERSHKNEDTQGVMVAAVDRISDQLVSVFEKQDQLSVKMIESFKEHNARFKNIEDIAKKDKETLDQMRMVTSHWKTIVWVIFISAIIGFSFETGIRDMLHVVAGDKIAQINKVVNSSGQS